jgi:hypothetical protein
MSRQATKPFYTARDFNYFNFLVLRHLVVFIENIRDSIEIQNGGLLHSSLSKRWIIEYKGTLFFAKCTFLCQKNERVVIVFCTLFSKTHHIIFVNACISAPFYSTSSLRKRCRNLQNKSRFCNNPFIIS